LWYPGEKGETRSGELGPGVWGGKKEEGDIRSRVEPPPHQNSPICTSRAALSGGESSKTDEFGRKEGEKGKVQKGEWRVGARVGRRQQKEIPPEQHPMSGLFQVGGEQKSWGKESPYRGQELLQQRDQLQRGSGY